MLTEPANDDIVTGDRAFQVLYEIGDDVDTPALQNGFESGRLSDGGVIEKHKQPSTLCEILVNLLQFKFGQRHGGRGDDEQIAIHRHGAVAEQLEIGHRDVILGEDGTKFQIADITAVVERGFAVALQKIRRERLGIFQREQHRGELHLAVKRDGFAPELAFLFVRYLLQRVLRERVAGGDLNASVAVKDDEVLVRLRIQLVLFLYFFGLARVTHIIHCPNGNARVHRAILVQQRDDVRIKIILVLGVIIKRHAYVIGQRPQDVHGLRGQLDSRL